MFNIFTVISLFVLGPLFFYPLTFCPFQLPYLYCFICPARCAGGRARGIILLAVLGLNIYRESFCRRLCPLGTAQALLFKLKLPKFSLPEFARSFKYIILVLTLIALWLTLRPPLLQVSFMGLSLGRIFIASLKSLLIALLLLCLAASVFIYRPFCRNFCPIGALSKFLPKK